MGRELCEIQQGPAAGEGQPWTQHGLGVIPVGKDLEDIKVSLPRNFLLIAQRYSRTVRTQPTRCGMIPLEQGAGTRHPFMVPSPAPSRDSGNDPAAKARSVSSPARAALPGDFKSRPAQTRRPGLTFSVQSLMQVL